MDSGIYCIVNLINGKMYIGSSKELITREINHWLALRRGAHHNVFLQRSWDKYGESSFEFRVICYCSDLFKFEQLWIDCLRPEYNIGSVGGGDNISRHPNNQQFRELQSRLVSERIAKMSDEERQYLSHPGDTNPN